MTESEVWLLSLAWWFLLWAGYFASLAAYYRMKWQGKNDRD